MCFILLIEGIFLEAFQRYLDWRYQNLFIFFKIKIDFQELKASMTSLFNINNWFSQFIEDISLKAFQRYLDRLDQNFLIFFHIKNDFEEFRVLMISLFINIYYLNKDLYTV